MDSTVILVVVIVVLAIGIPAVVLGLYATSARRRQARTAVAAAEPSVKPRSLGDRLASTRSALGGRLAVLSGRPALDDVFWAELEETLVAADLGVATASEIASDVKRTSPADGATARAAVRDQLVALFGSQERHLPPLDAGPVTILVVGVNGSGKTTTIAKLAQRYQELGASTLLGAADTFRAGAAEQLRSWAGGLGVNVVGGEPGSDPAAVAHDAIAAAKRGGVDVVIIDTAGRLHSDSNLMEELSKVARVADREADGIDEVLLVLDGTGGQNGIAQAKTFTDAVGVTGIIITKLDGTAKGGIAAAVEGELGVPIKLIGVGESADDLVPFVPSQFVDALLEVPDE